METLGTKVRILFMKLGRQEKAFLGGPPYTEEVERQFANYERYKAEGLLNRTRVCLGTCIFDDEQNVIGYQASTIMQDANPSVYERKYVGLKHPLNYVQRKIMFVDPDYWGKGISDKLLDWSLALAHENNKDSVGDVIYSNQRMIHFLTKHGLSKRYEWRTRKGTLMYRFVK